MPALTATRPAAPFEDAKARAAAAVEAARDEIVDLSHRIHADPEPAFEETHAAMRELTLDTEHADADLAELRGALAAAE